MKLRVWWIPQVPMNGFFVPVKNLEQGKWLLDVLAKYDAFQFDNRVKPDYCNAGGLSVLEDGEWVDWYDDDGNDIDGLGMEECVRLDHEHAGAE